MPQLESDRFVGAMGKRRHLVLGLDPGVASCGFALLDTENHEILEMGVRLFDSPVVPKTQQSKAAVRRGFRSTRRNLDRTRNRLKHCLRLLKDEGIVPKEATPEFFHTAKGDRPPLRLRVEGLDRLLSDREWSIVLYSLCKRRGYIPHGEGDVDGASDDGKVLKAIGENAKSMAEGEFRTVGEWLSSLDRSRNHEGKYDNCISHAQLKAEVCQLFDCQRKLGNVHATPTLERAYLEVFDWQKPREAFDERTYGLVGNCVYFPEEKRAARCTLTSEMVSAHGALGNVTILFPDGTKRSLTPEERDEFIGTLFSPIPIKGNKSCKVTFGMMRKCLDLDARAMFKGVRPDDEKTREVYCPRGWRALKKAEHEELVIRLRKDRDLADDVMEAAAYSSSADVLKSRLSRLDLSEEELEALAHLPYSSRALNGYGSRSKKALDLLLDSFDDPDVLTLTEAEDASGLLGLRLHGTSGIEAADRLVPYGTWLSATGRTNNNPVVMRAMAQMRKVVNAVCREWGVPNEIHVELARQLALPKKAIDRIQRSNRQNEKNNERIRGQISEIAGESSDQVKGSVVEKWRLWEEQDNQDIYTGEGIDALRLVKDPSYAQVDHILPFSRTGDNSRHNKVLVLARNNQLKRNRSPYEWMNSKEEGAPDWSQFMARVEENRHISPRKRSFLLERDLSGKEGDFQNRNLVDTSYMSREVCMYLSDCLAFPDDGSKSHVVPTRGAASAWLRRSWGLNFGLAGEKDRSDDRHHATDACVIAACNRSLVARTAKMSEFHGHMTAEEKSEALKDAMPWPSFSEDVRAWRERVIPTRFVPHKGVGELFEQTVYKYVGMAESGKDLIQTKDKTPKVAGNAVVSEGGKSAVKVGGMMCLRLWHDPKARKGRGQWYADPVYYADLPAMQSGSYVPRIARAHTGRKLWQPIDLVAVSGEPLQIYLGDVVRVGGQVGRFAGLNIDTVGWEILDPLTSERLAFPTIGKLDNSSSPAVIREDILGHCWRGLSVDNS